MDSLRMNNADGSVDVQIRKDVIGIIAGLAASEVEGVHSMAGGISNEISSRLGRKNLSAGVIINQETGGLVVDLEVIAEMGFSIPEVAEKVQEKVKNSIESMTDLKVKAVNVRIVNVNIDN